MHKTIKRTPNGSYIIFKSLKTNTNRMTNEERTKNDVEVDYGRNLVAPRPCFSLIFFFFSLISLNFSQCWTLEPFTQPPSCLFIAKDGIRGHGSSPKRVVAST